MSIREIGISTILNGVAREVDLSQGSPEWLKWREGGIGASEIPTILGENPYEKPRPLWEVKIGKRKPFSGNRFTRHGQDNETLARAAYTLAHEPMIPRCYESLKVPYMRASLDGINFDGDTILEIKCPIKPPVFLAAQQGQVMPYYYGQCQAQLWITGAARAHFWVWFEHQTALVEVFPDPAYHGRMLAYAQAFWDAIQAKVWPFDEEVVLTRNTALDMGDDLEWNRAAEDYKNAYVREVAAAAEREAAEAILKRKATGHECAIGAGVKVTNGSKAGNVDFRAIPAIIGMSDADLEQYRKPRIPTTSIRIVK